MVKYFHFHNSRIGSERHVDRQLISSQCDYTKENGQICRKRCLIGLTKCWIHLQSEHRVRIRNAGALGQGLFASDGTNGNKIVFRRDDYILSYEGGERLTEAEVDARYGPDTVAPYTMRLLNGDFEDCAIRRCAAALINSGKGLKGVRNNCIFVNSVYGNDVYIVCARNIRNGEQLFANYGEVYTFNDDLVQTSTNSRKNN
jgi:hypothetical protein